MNTALVQPTCPHDVSRRGFHCVGTHVLAPGPVRQGDCGCSGESCSDRRDPSPREHAQVVNLEAALFWHEVSETEGGADNPSRGGTRVRPSTVGRAWPTALSLVSANVLTLHPADEQPDSLIGCNFSGHALDLQAAMHEWSADLVGIQEARDRHDSQRSGLHFDVCAAAAARGRGGVQLWLH